MEFEPLSNQVIGAALEVHKNLGPGLLEAVYGQALAYELLQAGLKFQTQAPMPLAYKGIKLIAVFDWISSSNKNVVELKSVEALAPVHDTQLLTYLKLTGLKTALLINFNVPLLKNGIKRLVL